MRVKRKFSCFLIPVRVKLCKWHYANVIFEILDPTAWGCQTQECEVVRLKSMRLSDSRVWGCQTQEREVVRLKSVRLSDSRVWEGQTQECDETRLNPEWIPHQFISCNPVSLPRFEERVEFVPRLCHGTNGISSLEKHVLIRPYQLHNLYMYIWIIESERRECSMGPVTLRIGKRSCPKNYMDSYMVSFISGDARLVRPQIRGFT